MKKSVKQIACASLAGVLMTGSISGYAAVPDSIVKKNAAYNASKKVTEYQIKKSIYVKKKVKNTYKYYTYKGKKIKLTKGKTIKLIKKVTIKKASWGYIGFSYKKKNLKGYIPMSAIKTVKKVVPAETLVPSRKPVGTDAPAGSPAVPTGNQTNVPVTSATPFVTENPSTTATTSVTENPSATAAASVTENPSATATASVTGNPSATADTSVTGNPSATATASDTATPNGTAAPTDTTAPNGTMAPSDTAVPNKTVAPSETAAPNVTVAPSATVTPNTTATPLVAVTPNVTANPTDTGASNETAVPTVTKNPEVTENPSETKIPELSATPSATEEPKASATPEAVTSGGLTAIPQDPLKSEPTTQSESMNFFAYQLFAQLENQQNTCFSPYSIYMAFSMLDNGTQGEAKKEIEKILGIKDLNQWNEALQKLAAQLTGRESKLLTANKMWLNENVPLNPNIQKDFKDPIKKYYDADVDMVKDFGQATKDEINQWVESKTEHQIKNMADQLEEDDAFALVNAVYFSGVWKKKFDVFDTTEAVFTNQDGSESKVQMMNMKDKHFNYAENEKVAMLQLPYGEEGETVMDIILPKDIQKTLGETYGTMTYKEREALFDEADQSSYKKFKKIGIPKFELTTDAMRLKKALQATGMNAVFEEETSDYSKIGNVAVSEVFHKAKIAVDEGGTSAAAATLIQGAPTATAPSNSCFVADSPFIFIIRDKETDTILFMGEINQLSEKESVATKQEVLDGAKAEVIKDEEAKEQEDGAKIIRTYEELQKLIQTIDSNDSGKKNTIAKLRSYTAEYFKEHVLLFGGKITNASGLQTGNIIVVNEKDCFITVKIANKPSSFEELDKRKYCSFTIELPKNEKTDKIEKVYFR